MAAVSSVGRYVWPERGLRQQARPSPRGLNQKKTRDSVKRAGLAQREGRDLGFETLAAFEHHFVRAVHRAEGGLQGATRGVLEAFTLAEGWLMSDHTGAAHLFDYTVGVGDHPVAIHELYGLGPFIDDRDRVQEEPLSLARVGVIGRVARIDAHADAASQGFGGRHARNIAADSGRLPRDHQRAYDLRGKVVAKRASGAASNALRQPSKASARCAVPWTKS